MVDDGINCIVWQSTRLMHVTAGFCYTRNVEIWSFDLPVFFLWSVLYFTYMEEMTKVLESDESEIEWRPCPFNNINQILWSWNLVVLSDTGIKKVNRISTTAWAVLNGLLQSMTGHKNEWKLRKGCLPALITFIRKRASVDEPQKGCRWLTPSWHLRQFRKLFNLWFAFMRDVCFSWKH